jgi:hypothetical protein
MLYSSFTLWTPSSTHASGRTCPAMISLVYGQTCRSRPNHRRDVSTDRNIPLKMAPGASRPAVPVIASGEKICAAHDHSAWRACSFCPSVQVDKHLESIQYLPPPNHSKKHGWRRGTTVYLAKTPARLFPLSSRLAIRVIAKVSGAVLHLQGT